MMASPMDPMVKKARGIWSLLRVSHRVIHPRVRIRKSRKVPTFNSALHLYLRKKEKISKKGIKLIQEKAAETVRNMKVGKNK